MRSWLVCIGVVVSPVAGAETFSVGPGQRFERIRDVPWEDLGPGDVVEIHYRATPYKEKIIIATAGTAAAPITVRGVPDASGKLPIIDGANALTRTTFESWNEERGVIKVGGTDVPLGPPANIVIESLDVTGALPGTPFRDSLGQQIEYLYNAAAIYVDEGASVTIRGCTMRDSGNGLYVNAQASHVLVEKNEFKDNGIPGSPTNHHAYTEAEGIVFQFNRFGPFRPGSLGNGIEDRSTAPVIRYNWIEGGNHQIALFESDVFFADPGFGVAYVYGNVLIEPDAGGGAVSVAWGGGNGVTNFYRKGTLYFHHNTVLSARSDQTTIFDLPTNDESVYARNNIFATIAPGSTLSIGTTAGVHELSNNFVEDGHVQSHGAFTGMVQETGTVGGAAPGFVNENQRDVHLTRESPCVDKGIVLPSDMPAEYQPTQQYVDPRSGEARPTMGAPDLGAYENPLGGPGDDVDNPPPDDDEPYTPPPPTGDDDMGGAAGGCGCDVGRSPMPGGAAAVLGLCVMLALARRRRAR
jgi:hypothetical protein